MKPLSERDVRRAWEMVQNTDENKGVIEARMAALVRPGKPIPLWVVVRGVYTALRAVMDRSHPDVEATDVRFWDESSGLFFTITWTTELPDEIKQVVEDRQ